MSIHYVLEVNLIQPDMAQGNEQFRILIDKLKLVEWNIIFPFGWKEDARRQWRKNA